MPKTKKQKESIVQTLAGQIKKAKGLVIANFQGLTMKDSDELRGKCKDQKVSYIVTKKTFLKRAFQEAGYEVDTKAMEGGVSLLTAEADEVMPAQIIAAFAKTHDKAKMFGGILEGKLIDTVRVQELAKLPGKQQLLGQLVWTLNAPVSGFVNVLAGNLRGLVTVLGAIKDKKPV